MQFPAAYVHAEIRPVWVVGKIRLGNVGPENKNDRRIDLCSNVHRFLVRASRTTSPIPTCIRHGGHQRDRYRFDSFLN